MNQVTIFMYFVFTLSLIAGIYLANSLAPNLGILIAMSSILGIAINLLLDIARR
jgi:hypothetical protein